MKIRLLYLICLIGLSGCQTIETNSVPTKTTQGCSLGTLKQVILSDKRRIVVSVGKSEPCSIGSYSIRLYGANPQFPLMILKTVKLVLEMVLFLNSILIITIQPNQLLWLNFKLLAQEDIKWLIFIMLLITKLYF